MWFIVALIAGGLIGAPVLWLRSRDIKTTLCEWLIGVVGLLLVLFAIQNYFGTLVEGVQTAAPMYLLVAGLERPYPYGGGLAACSQKAASSLRP